MQYISTNSNEPILDSYQSVTGHTRNYNNTDISYVVGSMFEVIHDKSERSLLRWKRKIRETKPENEHPYYFLCKDGVYLYSTNILNIGRKIRKKKTPGMLRKTLVIDHTTTPLTSVNSTICHRLKKIEWDYYCGTRTKNEMDVSKCTNNMNQVFKDLQRKMPDALITMFYITEDDDDNPGNGLHNHFVIGVSQKGSEVRKHINQSLLGTGSKAPDVDKFRPEEDWLGYMIKKIRRFPDGWAIMTNSRKDAKILSGK